MKVLAELGLAETLITRATIARASVFVDERGKALGRLPYGDPKRYGQPAVSLSRALLFGLLAEEMRREEIPVHYEKRVNGIIESGDTVTIHCTDGGSVQGDLLIGADGARSATRGARRSCITRVSPSSAGRRRDAFRSRDWKGWRAWPMWRDGGRTPSARGPGRRRSVRCWARRAGPSTNRRMSARSPARGAGR